VPRSYRHQYISAQNLASRLLGHLCRQLLKFFDVVTGMVRVGKVRSPKEAIRAEQVNHGRERFSSGSAEIHTLRLKYSLGRSLIGSERPMMLS
jgi:hypothetical protein